LAEQRGEYRRQKPAAPRARSTPMRAARSWISLVLCDSSTCRSCCWWIPPGFQIGTEAERAGAPGKIMNFMNAMTLVTVPHLSVIIRKSYGRAYVCMGAGVIRTTSLRGRRRKSAS